MFQTQRMGEHSQKEKNVNGEKEELALNLSKKIFNKRTARTEAKKATARG